ncbi:FtsH protease activity modulator HflK [Curvibacter sp. APW13]|uniref:FtsH protease activity modulator HflK n=1 Tax=Curvibacter sp. APW13 TaxID=3077236 RepID=UPI0028DD5DB2|nr:FtsH protease activity modulator HflK [Curvibacter sp. APW13]MDT8991715.1 FtsH protease activity modulator HflK [Curvibacter sp. APW13]
MNVLNRIPRRLGLSQKWQRMFNLNDPRWGRGDDADGTGSSGQEPSPESEPHRPQQPSEPVRGNGGRRSPSGPPDLDELWKDFNKRLGGLIGGGRSSPTGGGGNGAPDMNGAGVGLGLIAGVVLLIWLATGFFIVQEGQQAVITQFGRYVKTVNAGFNWRLPYPIQKHELVVVTQIRSVDIGGRDTVLKATGLRESAMLTQDENIVDIKFAVQYRLNDARAYLFESKNPAEAVVQAAETAVREVVGRMKMDAALSEERDQIAPQIKTLMQTILDRYKVGIEVVGINLQQGGVRPPEQVQAAFDDVLKAGQERERSKNEAQAYANDVVPRAVGAASRLKEESEAYKSRVVAQAQGDAQRFRAVYNEYQKAPQVTRDRMYLDTMQQIYANVTKVMVESRQGGSLLYLPLDKLLQQSGATTGNPVADATVQAPAAPVAGSTAGNSDARSRDAARTRDRDVR